MTTPPPPPGERQPRDAAYWAITRNVLRVSDVPAQAVNLNVEGRRVAGALQGFGQLWQKTYQVRLVGAGVTPADVVRIWKEEFPSVHPPQSRFYPPLAGVAPGEVMLINASVQGMPVYTGVMVLYADDEAFTLMTPEGHMLAAWITFSAFRAADGAVVVQAHALERASDPMFELGLMLGGNRMNNRFWETTIRNVAARFGAPDATVETEIVCVDRRRQWRYAGNVRHNAGMRGTLHTLSAPIRLMRRRR